MSRRRFSLVVLSVSLNVSLNDRLGLTKIKGLQMFSASIALLALVSFANADDNCDAIVKIDPVCVMRPGFANICEDGTVVDYEGQASRAYAAYQSMQDCGGGQILIGGSSDQLAFKNGDSVSTLSDPLNGGLAAERAGQLLDRVLSKDGSDAFALRTRLMWLRDGPKVSVGQRYAFAWVVPERMISELGAAQDARARAAEESNKLRIYRARSLPDASTAWGSYLLAAIDSVCPVTVILHQDGMPEYIKGECECADEPMSSVDAYTTVTSWTSGPVGTGDDKVAYDFAYARQRWAGVAACPKELYGATTASTAATAGGDYNLVWDLTTGECRAPKSDGEVLVALLGEKLPRYDSEVFPRAMAYVARHGATVRGDILREGKVVVEFEGTCEEIQYQEWLLAEATRLDRYRGLSGTFAVVAAPGWAYPPARNPYNLEMGAVGNGEFHVGARWGWLNYRTSDTSEQVIVRSRKTKKTQSVKTKTTVGDVTTEITSDQPVMQDIVVRSVNANAMSFGVEGILGAGYHPVSCTLPGSVEYGGEMLVSGGRAANIGWSGGLGYTQSIALWKGAWVYSHQTGFVEWTLDVHPGGSVGNTTFELGLRQGVNMVTSDPTASALDLDWDAASEGYTTLVPVTSAVIGVRW